MTGKAPRAGRAGTVGRTGGALERRGGLHLPPGGRRKRSGQPFIVLTGLSGSGKSQAIRLKVTQGTKGIIGAKIRVSGPGISKTVRTGKNGLVTVFFTPSTAGIIKVQIVGAKACNAQRLGVVGTFQPPLTG